VFACEICVVATDVHVYRGIVHDVEKGILIPMKNYNYIANLLRRYLSPQNL